MDTLEARLTSIEAQLSSMNYKFDTLIRLEEKHSALADKVEGLGHKIHKHANIIMQLQHSSSLNSKSVGHFEKLVYMVVGSCFAGIAYLLVGGSI